MAAESGTLVQLARALEAKQVTSRSVTDDCLARIADANPSLNAFIAVLADEARDQAGAADREIAAGHYRGPLHGVPISLKDLIDLRGISTTAASRVRHAHIAQADALVTRRLRDAGAVFVGKTNLHEFALGTTNEDSAYGPARHPLDLSRSPGGSSGGSAVSVATRMAYASIGTDTGGSIRIPAAACGLVGLKPSHGDIPLDGIVPLSTTLDHVGPIGCTVDDVRIVYDVLRGEPSPRKPAERAVSTIRLGMPRDYFLARLDPQVSSTFDAAIEALRNAGADIRDVTIAHAGDIAPVYVHIALAEAAALHAKTLESRSDDYTANVRLRLETGRYILAEDYVRALRGRDVLRAEVDELLHDCDALVLPSLAIPAPKIGVGAVRLGAIEEPIRNVMVRLTQLFNITGHPAVTVPCGSTIERLPVGLQLAGRTGRTHDLLDVSSALERYLGPGTSG